MVIQNGDRSDPERPVLPRSIQHCGGRSGKGGAAGSLRPRGVTTWNGIGGGRAQHSLLCGRRSYRGPQHQLVVDDAYGGDPNV